VLGTMASRSDATPPAKAGLRILLVEDEELIAELFAETLSADGHDVALAGDGQEALKLFAAAEAVGETFDIVVTDVRMPRMDGVTLANRLRSAHPELPVVVVSGYASAEQLSALSRGEPGRLVVLPKPVNLTRLCTAVRFATHH
jgi:CheY-like chemotaxis protein